MERVKLNDGNEIPAIGFGVFQIPNDGPTYEAVLNALKDGYRLIDTAASYLNESDVGKAIKDSGIPREDIFVTSKLWLTDYGYEEAQKGIEKALKNLDTNYIDLFLLHHPYGDIVEAWKALEEAKQEGKIKSIGVSNMTPKYWKKFVSQFNTVPAVNQVEYNPLCQQKELLELMNKDGVIIEAWAPLGQGNKELLENPLIVELAEKYNKNPGQIILRFEIQNNVVPLPKSVNPERIKSNLDVFDFVLDEEEMKKIKELDQGLMIQNPEEPGLEQVLLKRIEERKRLAKQKKS